MMKRILIVLLVIFSIAGCSTDAQYFSKEEINAFRAAGHKVYSYINVVSIENFCDYCQKHGFRYYISDSLELD